MHRFWNRFIKPIIECVKPGSLLEIGAEFGWNTERLLQYCQETGAKIDIVDPSPHPALFGVLDRFAGVHRYHALKSLDAIPIIPPAEIVLLDGDHNWFTVYNELQLLYLQASKAGERPPIIMFHDVAWPYARRDMYYDPDGLTISDRHPYAYRGILPGQSELSDNGLNGHLANALYEGGPRNGVLTAVEDFQASSGIDSVIHRLPFFNGLGILVPEVRMTTELKDVIDGFYSPESLLETCAALEKDGMSVRAELSAMKVKLSQHAGALVRARERIAELEGELEAARRP